MSMAMGLEEKNTLVDATGVAQSNVCCIDRGSAMQTPNLAAQNARLDRQVERRLAHQPRFGVVRYADGSPYAVWDHNTNDFHPVADLLAPLFAVVGLEAA